jgi:hypothetical protein
LRLVRVSPIHPTQPPPRTHSQEGEQGGSAPLGYAIVEPELQVVGTTRSGRAVKSAAPLAQAKAKPPAAKKQKRAQQPQEEEEEGEAVGEEGDEQQGTAVDTEGKDANDWVCGICDELERSDQDRLVLCDGPCHGAFHQSCLGLSSEEVDAMAEWFCEQCTEGEHTVRGVALCGWRRRQRACWMCVCARALSLVCVSPSGHPPPSLT